MLKYPVLTAISLAIAGIGCSKSPQCDEALDAVRSDIKWTCQEINIGRDDGVVKEVIDFGFKAQGFRMDSGRESCNGDMDILDLEDLASTLFWGGQPLDNTVARVRIYDSQKEVFRGPNYGFPIHYSPEGDLNRRLLWLKDQCLFTPRF